MKGDGGGFYKIHWTGSDVIVGIFPAACGTAHGRLITNVTSDASKVNCKRCKRLAGFKDAAGKVVPVTRVPR